MCQPWHRAGRAYRNTAYGLPLLSDDLLKIVSPYAAYLIASSSTDLPFPFLPAISVNCPIGARLMGECIPIDQAYFSQLDHASPSSSSLCTAASSSSDVFVDDRLKLRDVPAKLQRRVQLDEHVLSFLIVAEIDQAVLLEQLERGSTAPVCWRYRHKTRSYR